MLIRQVDGTTPRATVTDTDPRTEDFGVAAREVLLADDEGDNDRLSVTLTTSLAPFPAENEVHAVRLVSVTEDWFRFLTDYQRYRSLVADINDGFVDPFPLHTNVPGGLGYFVLGHSQTFPVN